MTAIFVVSGLAVPAILAHIRVIQVGAFLMCISGGVVVYGTILVRAKSRNHSHGAWLNQISFPPFQPTFRRPNAFIPHLPSWRPMLTLATFPQLYLHAFHRAKEEVSYEVY